jgi:hypothetical protein
MKIHKSKENNDINMIIIIITIIIISFQPSSLCRF